MEEKENVYVETQQSERATEVEKAEGKVSTDLGKFRSVDALLRAYEALEAEFTRRSQRLKELEAKADNFNGLEESEGNAQGGGVEKLRKRAAQKREEDKRFTAFVSELESVGAQTETQVLSQTQETRQDGSNGSIDVADVGFVSGAEAQAEEIQNIAKPSVADARGENVLSADELYGLVCRDEGVRLKIVGEYLSSLGKSGAPLTLGGAGTLVAPPKKAKSIDEAGSMALRFFKNGAQNVN